MNVFSCIPGKPPTELNIQSFLKKFHSSLWFVTLLEGYIHYVKIETATRKEFHFQDYKLHQIRFIKWTSTFLLE